MWTWLERLLRPLTPSEVIPTPQQTPLETISTRIVELETWIEREERALGAMCTPIVEKLIIFFRNYVLV
jgi:hypothetical protein